MIFVVVFFIINPFGLFSLTVQIYTQPRRTYCYTQPIHFIRVPIYCLRERLPRGIRLTVWKMRSYKNNARHNMGISFI